VWFYGKYWRTRLLSMKLNPTWKLWSGCVIRKKHLEKPTRVDATDKLWDMMCNTWSFDASDRPIFLELIVELEDLQRAVTGKKPATRKEKKSQDFPRDNYGGLPQPDDGSRDNYGGLPQPEMESARSEYSGFEKDEYGGLETDEPMDTREYTLGQSDTSSEYTMPHHSLHTLPAMDEYTLHPNESTKEHNEYIAIPAFPRKNQDNSSS